MTIRAVLPVKAFARAKVRLSGVRSPAERALLAETLATATLAALARFDPIVPCDDPQVATWASAHHALPLDAPRGLNAAVATGIAVVESGLVAICHADLAFPDGLADLLSSAGPCIVSDRHGDGTNVLVLPAGTGFRVAYGPSSFRRHLDEAGRLGIDLEIIDDELLAWDVDGPDDLCTPSGWGPPSWEVE